MGRKSQMMKANLYEDYEEFEEEVIFSSSPQTKKERKAAKQKEVALEKQKNPFGMAAISTKPVDCVCNFCNSPMKATLLNIIYSQTSEVYIPFVGYHCDSCGKSGQRSVMKKALPLDDFEKKYF